MDYKDTLNLPVTDFPMKADLNRREPEIQKKWEEMGLYGQIRKNKAGCPRYILHDGPPYPTGDLHIGTGLNKILKDLIVRYYTMQCYDAPYIPGWDCHGLPIEHMVMQQLGEKARGMDKLEIRKRCREYAMRFVKAQKAQFKALGVSGDWESPYLTLNPEYEAAVLDLFGRLVEEGYVYRSLRPIHWCMRCQTALAEAELEYNEETSPSIFVNFKMVDDLSALLPLPKGEAVHILIWTTTPWTIPANLAIALHPESRYAAIKYVIPLTQRKEVTLLAQSLVDNVMEKVGVKEYQSLGSIEGKALEGKHYQHPLRDYKGILVLADYVSLSEGTGCVHTAPGHGLEDYLTGQKYNLPIFSPVDSTGRFTEEAGDFKGLNVKEANPRIVERLKFLEALVHKSFIKHSYPHCWRCKEHVIFRATKQWFVSLEHKGLRKRLLESVKNVKWIPAWGMERISGMIHQRPDWCISRQRAWGVPIPAFYCEGCEEVLLKPETVAHVRDIFRQHGSDSWFSMEAKDLLPPGTKCGKCGGSSFRKEMDIFDVWFESGSSHHAVLNQRELSFPADLYLEGTDQHRGWFQLSLLPSVAAWGKAPFKAVLTHGFVVDEKGEKMSKSLGNFISVEDALKDFGADIIRLWASSQDYQQDINTSLPIIGRMSDVYRRIRNTFRYLLGNLYDFDPKKDRRPYGELPEIDLWALSKTQRLIMTVTQAYNDMEFHRVHHSLHYFCAVDMSAFYFDILKDRLYTWAKKSPDRRAAQTVLQEILHVLVKLSAPLLVHTAEEVWSYIKHKQEDLPSVHLASWPKENDLWINESLEKRWGELFRVREEVYKALEVLRTRKKIGKSVEARVSLYTEEEEFYHLLHRQIEELPALFIVSEAQIVKGRYDGQPEEVIHHVFHSGASEGEASIRYTVGASPSSNKQCQRCWNYFPTVGKNTNHPTLCVRCVEVVEGL
ncbi:MAG TPA: isoleucine--tRNA ligase [Candidatus Hypogeohydataceae bacterium YC40]